MSTEAMPPLPEPWADTINGWAYTAEQMHLYARTYAADLERRLQEAGRVINAARDAMNGSADAGDTINVPLLLAFPLSLALDDYDDALTSKE